MSAAESAPLTPAQRELMEIVWAEGEVTVSEVRDLLEAKRNLARNTVLTMMVRLEERGWLQHRTQGRTFVYSAARPKTVSLGMRVSQMVDRLFAGSPEDLVTALIEYRGLTAAETRRIRSMIEQAEAKQKQSGQRRKNQQ
ncbi:MAG: BlaI/MecI/CopY family transcriptional regulator [Planctomycetaceae bacterium]|nr:BlaI/MecI/CopY family transcriptional regulator [Planctomycetaceae bacterium]